MTTLPFRPRALEPGDPRHPQLPAVPAVPAAIRLLAPGAVPPGAVVLGVIVALPTDQAPTTAAPTSVSTPAVASPLTTAPHQQARPLTALPAPGSDPGRTGDESVTHPRPGLVVERWGRRVLNDGVEVTLTRREFELLEYLSRHPDRVFTRSQLLAAVWDITDPRYAPDRTVDVHVSRLRRKLGPAHADALQSLRGVGYRWSSRGKLAGRRS